LAGKEPIYTSVLEMLFRTAIVTRYSGILQFRGTGVHTMAALTALEAASILRTYATRVLVIDSTVDTDGLGTASFLMSFSQAHGANSLTVKINLIPL
jgi:hypothetical protein